VGVTQELSARPLIENRNGLVIDLQMAVADGPAERRNALETLDNNLPGQRHVTVAGGKGYDTSDFVEDCRERKVLGTRNLHHAAVGKKLDTGHEAGRIAREKDRRPADLPRVGKPPERISFAHALDDRVDRRGS
jgi:hypothetical protein